MKRYLHFLLADARHIQIFYLLIFLFFGILNFSWGEDWMLYTISIGTCLLVQGIGIFFTTKNWTGLKSSLISSLSICLMFNGSSPWVYALAAALSIGSKYLIRYKGKHVFNPTNFGILVTILITQQAWVSPGQWGSEVVFIFLMLLVGSSLLLKVGRIETALSFLVTYSGLQCIYYVIYLGWPFDFWLHSLSSGTLLLFTFFMITDPVTSPKSFKARIIWAAAVGVLSFGMSSFMYMYDAPLWALFIISPTSILLNKMFKGKSFSWKTPDLASAKKYSAAEGKGLFLNTKPLITNNK